MPDQLSVSREIRVPADRVWAMVADVTRMGEWSPETVGCTWLGKATGPAKGAKFRGTNRNGTKEWKTVATVVDCDPGRVFAFAVNAMGMGISEWRYTFEPTTSGCRVTESWTDRRNGLLKKLSPRASGVTDRAGRNRETMEQTLERLAAAAEAGP